jgi:hypothetical protein
MKLPRITQLVREQAKFTHYEEGNLWYQVGWNEDDGTLGGFFDFPIPVEDASTGKFLSSDRAMFFMRWIRRHLEYLQGALAEGVYDQ